MLRHLRRNTIRQMIPMRRKSRAANRRIGVCRRVAPMSAARQATPAMFDARIHACSGL